MSEQPEKLIYTVRPAFVLNSSGVKTEWTVSDQEDLLEAVLEALKISPTDTVTIERRRTKT
jgi:hypothetical protein